MSDKQDETNSQPFFQLQRLYLKDISCKAPHVPGIYQEQGQPTTNFELQIKHQPLQANHYEVVLQINAIAKITERTVFNLDIQQAGLFKLEHFAEPQLGALLKAYCPSLLYPYLCRAVAEATLQAGFPPLLLSPVNFDQLYQQQQATPAVIEQKPIKAKEQTPAVSEAAGMAMSH